MKKIRNVLSLILITQLYSCAPEKVRASESVKVPPITTPEQLSDIEVSEAIKLTTALKSTEIVLRNLPDGAMLKTTSSFRHTSLNSRIEANSSILVYTLSDSFISSVSDASSFNDKIEIEYLLDDQEFTYILSLTVDVIKSDSTEVPTERVVQSTYGGVLEFRRGSLEYEIVVPNYDVEHTFLSSSFTDSSFDTLVFDEVTGELTIKSANTFSGQRAITGEIKTFDTLKNEIIKYIVTVNFLSTKFELIKNGEATKVDFGALGFGLGESFSQKELLSTNLHPEINIGFAYISQRLADPLDEDHLDLKFEPINGGTRATFSPVDLNLLEPGVQPEREYEVIFTLENGEEVVAIYQVDFSVFDLEGETTAISVSGLSENTAPASSDTRLLNSIRRAIPFDLKEAHALFTIGNYAILDGFVCDLYNEDGNQIDQHFAAEVTLSSVNGRQFNVDADEATYNNGDDFFMFCFGSIIDLDDGVIYKTIERRIYTKDSFKELNNTKYWSDSNNDDSQKTLMWHWRK